MCCPAGRHCSYVSIDIASTFGSCVLSAVQSGLDRVDGVQEDVVLDENLGSITRVDGRIQYVIEVVVVNVPAQPLLSIGTEGALLRNLRCAKADGGSTRVDPSDCKS